MMELLQLERLLNLEIYWLVKLFQTIRQDNYLGQESYYRLFFGAKI
jgi:hypothetical protein